MPDSPSTALFSNKETKFKQITDSHFVNDLSLDDLKISNARASGMYFLICLVSKPCTPDVVRGCRRSTGPIN